MPDGFRKGLHALIDTGCEINLIKKGLIPQKYFQKSKKGVRLVTASGSLLGGVDQEVRLDLVACGYQRGQGANLFLKPSAIFRAAVINIPLLSAGKPPPQGGGTGFFF